MPEIVLKGINKYFRQVAAVQDLNLVIADQHFHTLLGPSGCGKTTTLRMIAGLEKPSSGEITTGSQTLFSSETGIMVPPAKRGIGLIFQDYALWPHMTVAANISFGLEVKRLNRAERKARIDSILKRVQLSDLGDRHPSELSGGQQQRVAMARMLVVEPAVLLMDEPLSNLDAKLRLTMRSELKRLHRELGATTIYVTHDQREALAMSDMITVMFQGRVQQNASPTELYERPANLFVAGFVGSPAMNLLSAQILGFSERRLLIELKAAKNHPLRINPIGGLDEGDDVVLGIRAEDVVLRSKPQSSDSIAGIVQNVLPAGSENFVEIQVGDEIVTARTERKIFFAAGSTTHFSFAEGALHLFDPHTGNRIG
jgi:multiple sugar transport system ATP-binding protein